MPIDPTPRSDYEHWNEDRDFMWWQEVGKHAADQNDPPEPDLYDAWEDARYDDEEID